MCVTVPCRFSTVLWLRIGLGCESLRERSGRSNIRPILHGRKVVNLALLPSAIGLELSHKAEDMLNMIKSPESLRNRREGSWCLGFWGATRRWRWGEGVPQNHSLLHGNQTIKTLPQSISFSYLLKTLDSRHVAYSRRDPISKAICL